MLKSRFRRDLDGEFGAYWKREAEKEIAKTAKMVEDGEITIDSAGIARNCIGRVVMDDVLEVLTLVTDKVNAEATHAARDKEVHEELEQYRKEMANYQPSGEELMEMRAAFGAGATVVNVLTGNAIQL